MSEIREPHGNQPYPGTDPYPGPLTVTPPESYEAKIKRLEARVAELEEALTAADQTGVMLVGRERRYREALEKILENEELDRTTERIATTALNQKP